MVKEDHVVVRKDLLIRDYGGEVLQVRLVGYDFFGFVLILWGPSEWMVRVLKFQWRALPHLHVMAKFQQILMQERALILHNIKDLVHAASGTKT